MDDIYHVPKYKPGDMVIFKWPLYQETPDDPAFTYRYSIILSADSTKYQMLELVTGVGAPMYISRFDPSTVDEYESKVLYHVDADKIRDLCCEGPQI